MVVCVESLLLHLLSLELVVLIHTLSHILEASVLVLVLDNDRLPLGFHLLREEPVFLGLEVLLHLLFDPLLLLLLEDLPPLVLVHALPVIGQDSVPTEHGLACPLSIGTNTVF